MCLILSRGQKGRLYCRHARGIGGGSAKQRSAESSKKQRSPTQACPRLLAAMASRGAFRWKQELAAPVFVAVRITDVNTPSGVVSSNMEAQP